MDDLQFRRTIYAEPNSQDDALLDAIKKDPKKKQFAQDIASLDDKIAQALKVEVPDDLSDKLILRQTLASHQVQKKKKRLHLALAASVAIMAGLLINTFHFSHAYNNLGDYALAHVYHEQGDFNNEDAKRVSLASLNQKMAAFNGTFTQSIGNLISADYCRFDGMKSLHLVFQGKNSPVTVFVVPQNDEVSFSKTFNDETFFGGSARFHNTNVIVIGDQHESLPVWQKSLGDSINWSI